jgi:Zn-dependent protease
VLAQVLLFLAVLIPSVILHEIAHGWSALAFGDDTAKRAGRLTLNPIPHIDVFGTLLLPGLLALSGFGVFGYAKPVPVNQSRMRRPRDHGLIVALAGPAVNIVLAVLAALILRGILSAPDAALRANDLTVRFLIALGVTNVVLAAFNLLPIPPLDGSAVIERVLPEQLVRPYMRLRQYSMAILLVLVLLLPGVLRTIFTVARDIWLLLL